MVAGRGLAVNEEEKSRQWGRSVNQANYLCGPDTSTDGAALAAPEARELQKRHAPPSLLRAHRANAGDGHFRVSLLLFFLALFFFFFSFFSSLFLNFSFFKNNVCFFFPFKYRIAGRAKAIKMQIRFRLFGGLLGALGPQLGRRLIRCWWRGGHARAARAARGTGRKSAPSVLRPLPAVVTIECGGAGRGGMPATEGQGPLQMEPQR